MTDYIYLCETCRQEVDPRDPSIVFAVEMVKTEAMDAQPQYIEGLGQFFHGPHYPGGQRWQKKDKPEEFR